MYLESRHAMTSPPATESIVGRTLRALRPSHQHSAYSATVLLIAAQMLSRIFGYLREAYIAKAFGASPLTDVYYAAFQIPDNLYYIVAGGAASITFVSIYSRYLAEKREGVAQRVFSVVLSVMTVALVVLIVLGEVFTRPLVLFWFPKFTPEQVELCVYLTRILLPMQLFFYVGGTMSAVLQTRRLF